MLRIVPSVTTLEQHHRAMAQGAHEYRLPACPHCGLGKPWRHGCYQRKVDRHAGPNGARQVARVCRFLCRGCRHTHSRLPLCIAPLRWYDWAVQQLALMLLLAGTSLRAAAKRVAVDRHTARRWRGWLDAAHATRFVFHLRGHWSELGRTADGPPFWREVFARPGLAQAMACLDRLMTVP